MTCISCIRENCLYKRRFKITRNPSPLYTRTSAGTTHESKNVSTAHALIGLAKTHHLGRESQEPGERVGQKLPREEEADVGGPAVVRARGAAPEPPEEVDGDLHPVEPRRVWAAAGPVDPRQAPVGGRRRLPDVEERRQVVLVGVAAPAAEAPEDREVDAVGDDVGGEAPVQVEPLGALAPLRRGHDGAHAAVVAAAPRRAGLVVGLEEHLGGVDEVRVDGGEVEERDVRLREEDEAGVGGVVQQRVRQQPALRLHHAHVAPFHLLQIYNLNTCQC